ncbi:MAG TPA: sigma-70 family RNA polymerase sigma factor [Thermoleophilaceae bacterium]|nr:sigma-70 family RNA polymerase sigma factor [Thermoleophilaceae bacterium]
MEASALRQSAALPALAGRSPLLRLQTDERLIALTRRGHHGAFEALVQRYQPRLLAFCRHMLGSQEDAEDVLQEVFTAAFNAMLADERPINARPWLYRIARNRSLNHLRRPQPAGQDSMDIFERDGGATTADTVHKREEFRQIVADVHELPETQRTALLLREIDALSYDQIAEAMDTTIPSVKSLLVRARVSLAEAAESRLLTCAEVRLELGQVAEGLARTTAPVRRHLKTCDRCRTFRGELRKTTRALAAVYPIGPLIFLKKLWVAKAGLGGASAAGAAASGGAAAGGSGMAGVAATAAGGLTAGGAVSAGVSTLASKAAAGMAAAVIVTAGAVEVKHVSERHFQAPPAQVAAAPAPRPAPEPPSPVARPTETQLHEAAAVEAEPVVEPVVPEPAPVVEPVPAEPVEPPAATVQEESSTVTLPPREEEPVDSTTPPGEPTDPAAQPGTGPTLTEPPPLAPAAGEPGGTAQPAPPPPAQ